MAITPDLEQKGIAARLVARALARTDSATKNQALENIAKALETDADIILAANAKDMEAGHSNGLTSSLLDRLLLNSDRLKAMADGARVVAGLPDPIGQELDSLPRPDGLVVARRLVPLGVVGVIGCVRLIRILDGFLLRAARQRCSFGRRHVTRRRCWT